MITHQLYDLQAPRGAKFDCPWQEAFTWCVQKETPFQPESLLQIGYTKTRVPIQGR
jgi:hypothetical protein